MASKKLCSLVLLGCNDIIDFEDHFDDLRCKLELLLLRHDRLEDALLEHVVGAEGHGIDTDEGVLLLNLHLLDLAYIFDRVETRVLSQRHGDLLESVSEGSHGVLLDTVDLVSSLGDLDGASELSGTTTANDVLVLDHVTDDAESIEEAALGLITNGAGTTTDENGDSLRVLALLDQKHLLVRGTEGVFLDDTGLTELIGRDLLETGDDASTSCNSEQLNLDTTNPTDSREVVVHEQMVSLVIETPLAKHDVGTGVLDLGDHISEVLLLHLIQLLVVLSRLDFETVLGLGLRGLERAGEDQNLSVVDLLLHLRVREVLIENDTLNELRVGKGATSLGNNLDEVEVDILTLDVGDVENGLDGKISEMVLALRHDLGAESSHGAFSQVLVVILLDVDLLLDLLEPVDSNLARLLETICNLERVNALVKQLLGLLEDGASKHNNTGSAVTDLVILRSRKLDEELGSLMMDLQGKRVSNLKQIFFSTYLHLFKNGGAIIGDDDFTIGRHEHLVHTLGTERGLEEGSDSSRSQDVNLNNSVKCQN